MLVNFFAWFWTEFKGAVRGLCFFMCCGLALNIVVYGGLYLDGSFHARHRLNETEYRAVVIAFGKRMDRAMGETGQHKSAGCNAEEAGR